MEIVSESSVSIVRACKLLSLDRSMYYYQTIKDDSEVELKLRWYAEHYPSRGFPEYYKRIRREGFLWNHKRVRRVYLKLKMNKRKKYKRRFPNPEKTSLLQPLSENLSWSIDFMSDSLENGRRFRTFNVLDDYNREALLVDVDYSYPSIKIVEKLNEVIQWRGKPASIRSDNGPEFIAKDFELFCQNSGIKHVRSQKGKPMQNGYIERFNRTYREDVLDMNIFQSMDQVRILTEKFMADYNRHHPHKSLNNKPPIEFLKIRKKYLSLL